jgi:hypothetical protein
MKYTTTFPRAQPQTKSLSPEKSVQTLVRRKKMIIASHQPNYLPWLGLFEKIQNSDLFIIEDNVQFENGGFTNRNKIKTTQGIHWLTVPKEHTGQKLLIVQVKIAPQKQQQWQKQHWQTLKHFYHKAPYWKEYADFFEDTYSQEWIKLIDLNMYLLKGIMDFLAIDTPLIMASALPATGKKSDLILSQCKILHANTYFSGIGAKDYINVQRFTEEGIDVIFQNFDHPTYLQLHGEFTPNLSAVDYLFCTGAKSWNKYTKPIDQHQDKILKPMLYN